MKVTLGFILIISIMISDVLMLTKEHNRSILLVGSIKNYCDMTCGGQKHTLCGPIEEIPIECGQRFHEYEITKDFKRQILNGHNGIRNRVASLMQASNMNQLEWDDELSNMASIWIRNCHQYGTDPCAKLPRKFDESSSYTLVNQNTAYMVSRFLPPHFLPMVLRIWYYERNTMKPPMLNEDEEGSFDVENNFTQLIWATAHRIGCAMARFRGGYQLVCNYHPYGYPIKAAFKEGVPCTECPNNLPLCGKFFEGLCTADHGYRNYYNKIILIVLIIINLL